MLRWFRIGCLLPRVKRAHPHVSTTLLSWDIPLNSFNGSLWDVLLRCSKLLLGAWLDSFTMILRCWLVKWAHPLVSMTLWSRVMFNWKAVYMVKWAVLHHRKSMGQIRDAPAPPGVQLLPHFEVWSYRACQPLQMWQMSHFCEIHSLSYEAWAVLHHRKSMGQLWDAPAPQGATFTPFWGMVLQSLPASSNVANFTFLWNPLSELRGVKVFRNVKSMRFFLPLFCPWGKHRTPDRL